MIHGPYTGIVWRFDRTEVDTSNMSLVMQEVLHICDSHFDAALAGYTASETIEDVDIEGAEVWTYEDGRINRHLLIDHDLYRDAVMIYDRYGPRGHTVTIPQISWMTNTERTDAVVDAVLSLSNTHRQRAAT